MTAHDKAMKAAREAAELAHLSGAGWLTVAEAAVTAAAPQLLAPVEAEVARLREHRTSLTDAAITLAHQWERERDEAVAAERRRIAEAIRAVPVQAWNSEGHWLLANDVFAAIAEGETSTDRDVDPGNAQDARRICPACDGTGYGPDVVTGRTDLCPCCWGSRTLRALTDAGDDAPTTTTED